MKTMIELLARRPAAASDLDEIMRLEEICFTSSRFKRNTFRRYMRVPHAVFQVLADSDGSLAGYLLYCLYKKATVLHVIGLAVDPSFRRRGLGRFLMQEVVANSRKVSETRLEVRHDNPGARELYSSLGFETAGVVPGYYEDGCDAVQMILRPCRAAA